jgi:hypothetical protein
MWRRALLGILRISISLWDRRTMLIFYRIQRRAAHTLQEQPQRAQIVTAYARRIG